MKFVQNIAFQDTMKRMETVGSGLQNIETVVKRTNTPSVCKKRKVCKWKCVKNAKTVTVKTMVRVDQVTKIVELAQTEKMMMVRVDQVTKIVELA